MDYELELTAVQTWLKSASGLNSWRRDVAPPKLARPVVIWESPYRGRARHLHRYAYVQRVRYYGKLFVNSVDEVLRLQQLLNEDIENRCGILDVLDKDGVKVGLLKSVELEFNETEGLDVPFRLNYEVAYTRTRPQQPPAPTYVYTKVTSQSVPKVQEYTEAMAVSPTSSDTDKEYMPTGTTVTADDNIL